MERVERFVLPESGSGPRVDESGCSRQRLIGTAGTGGTVEIANQEKRNGLIAGRDAITEQRRGFLPREFHLMIEMRIPNEELTLGRAIAQSNPGRHANMRVIPGDRPNHVRRVGQPEMVERDGLESIPAKKDGAKFIATSARAAEADPFVIRQIMRQIAELTVNAFLGADDIGRRLFDGTFHHGAAIGPGVGQLVARESKIVGHHAELQ